jgi:hypothetical protein
MIKYFTLHMCHNLLNQLLTFDQMVYFHPLSPYSASPCGHIFGYNYDISNHESIEVEFLSERLHTFLRP